MSLSRWRFPLLVAALLIAFELATIGVMAFGAPAGYRWLGATVSNTSDVAVYLNYLAQGKNGLLLANLYNDGPQFLRFDLFWSLGGLLVRAGMAPILAHEVLRWLCTLALAFALVATARAVTQNEKQARLATLFMVSGMSTGWIFVIYTGLTHAWTPFTKSPADLVTEFSVAPVLLGGAHMILSFALQMLAVRWIWEGLRDKRRGPWAACAVLLALSFFHPYFIPLFGLISLAALLVPLREKAFKTRERVIRFFIINAAMLPGLAYYVWLLLRDADFRTHHLSVNILPLDPPGFWLLALLPIIIAAIYMWRRKIPKDLSWSVRPDWVIAWIIAAVICMALPFPWKRKYTQALLPALVIMTLPFWFLATEYVRKYFYKPIRWLIVLVLLFPFLLLFRTQTLTSYIPRYFYYFFAPESQSRAWQVIKDLPDTGSVLATSAAANIWTPAYTLRAVWIGHNHETPEYAERIKQFNVWEATDDPALFAKFLQERNITTVLAVTATDTQRCATALQPPWHGVFDENGVSVWTQTH